MSRLIVAALRCVGSTSSRITGTKASTCKLLQNTSVLSQRSCTYSYFFRPSLIANTLPIINTQKIFGIHLLPLVRTLTKFSLKKGKRKTVKAVISRFYRLHWGGWIRTRAGRHKRLWKKRSSTKRLLRQHIFCNSTQSYLLDKMVTQYWRKPKYYVDDPYEPYHTREEFIFTRRKPHQY